MSRELLPCPFCGGDANAKPHSQHLPGCYFDAMASLKAAPKGDLSMAPEVVRAWNRRATQPAAGEPPKSKHRQEMDNLRQERERAMATAHGDEAVRKMVLPERIDRRQYLGGRGDAVAQGWNDCLNWIDKANAMRAQGDGETV